MASNINVNNIITTFPIPGQDNSSQGFRDNFTNIQDNFNNAKAEIEDLQRKAVLKTALNDDVLNNNMDGSLLIAADLINTRETQVDFGTVSGTILLDYTRGHNHSVNTNGPITVAFTRMPPNGKVGRIRLRVKLNSLSHTITFPSSVIGGVPFLKGYNPINRKITFTNADGLGTYIFEFSSDDQGATFNVQDLTRGTVPILIPASRTELGWVQIGNGLSVTEEGIISANVIPFASDTVPGLIKVGDKLSISGSGVLSVNQDIGLITSGELNGRLGHITPNTGKFTSVSVGSGDTTVLITPSAVRIDGSGGLNPVIQMGNINGYAIVHNLDTDNFIINRDEPIGSGITALTITPTGKIGIGNTSPESRLVVSGGGGTAVDIRDGGDLRLRNADNSGSVNLYCDTDNQLNLSQDLYVDRNLYAMGNVGIGTSTPGAKLDVVGSSTTDIFHVSTSTSYFTVGVTSGLSTAINSYQSGVGPLTLNIQNAGGASIFGGNVGIGIGSPAANLDVKGTVRLTNSSNSSNYGTIYDNVGLVVASNNSNPLYFYAGNNERMRINTTGNVEVGSQTPVVNGLRYFDVHNSDTGSPTSGADIRIISSNVAGTGTTSLDIVKRKNGSASIINFETDAAAYIGFNVGSAERARITSTGNLTVQNNIIDYAGNVREIPVRVRSSYTLILSDSGKMVSMTSGGVTVPSGVFTSGQTITLYNNSAFSQTITQGSGVTMYQVGTANTGNRTFAQRGLATLVCVDIDTFVLTGGGLS